MQHNVAIRERAVEVPCGPVRLDADLASPEHPAGVVVFAHGSGSGRKSPRNRTVAGELLEASLATLLIDLLTAEESDEDQVTGRWRFDVDLLAERVVAAIDWLAEERDLGRLPVGCFGASTGAAAALIAAAERPEIVHAVVSRGGRPDLAVQALSRVKAPTLLIVGGNDEPVIELNKQAMMHIPETTEKELKIIPGATHLFEEPGKLEEVASLARDWFIRHLEAAMPKEERGAA